MKTLRERVYDFLHYNYYESDELEHISDAVNTVVANEPLTFEKKVLRKLVQEVKLSWQKDLKATYTDEDDKARARKIIREATALIRELA